MISSLKVFSIRFEQPNIFSWYNHTLAPKPFPNSNTFCTIRIVIETPFLIKKNQTELFYCKKDEPAFRYFHFILL